MKLNDVIDLVYTARQSGIDIKLNDDNLQLKIPSGHIVDNALLENIKVNKAHIIDLLRNDKWRSALAATQHVIGVAPERKGLQKIPLSFSQERLWFINQLEGSSVQYHTSLVLRITGPLNTTALQNALQQVVARHEILRTVIEEEEGKAYQRVLERDDWQLKVIEDFPGKDNNETVRAFAEQLIDEPFDLSADHMVRAHLLQLQPNQSLLIITFHHIASDGWSAGIFISEFTELYYAYTQGLPVSLPPLPIQYADYAIWQRKHITGDMLAKKTAYWKEQLANVMPLNLPVVREQLPVLDMEGQRVKRSIDPGLTEKLEKLSREEDCTLYMTLLCAFNMLLHLYTGQEDICVGSSVAGRHHREVEPLIGFFSNTLALRSQVNAQQSVRQLLRKIRQMMLDAYDHQEVPFERVVEVLNIKREATRNPVFQVMFVLENTPDSGGGKIVEGINLKAEDFGVIKAKFDLTLSIAQTARGLQLAFTYRKNLFQQAVMEQMLAHYEQLLKLMITDRELPVAKLQLTDAFVNEKLLSDPMVAPSVFIPDKTIVELFEEQVQRSPEAVALVCMNDTLTYHEMNVRVNRLAHYLRGKGVRQGDLVPVCMHRSMDLLIGIWGILKAGAAYVPIDPDYPANRIAYMLQDTGAHIVVTNRLSRSNLPVAPAVEVIDTEEAQKEIAKASPTGPQITWHSSHPAYVLYTSGSTGMPKGVMVTHRNLVDYVEGLKTHVPLTACRSFVWMSALSADLGNTIIYGALLSGGALHILPQALMGDAPAVHQYFSKHAIDCLKIVPSHWNALTMESKMLLPKQLLIFGGEVLPATVVESIQATGHTCTIVNHYGPTETTIGKLLHVVEAGRKYERQIPIGRPFSHATIQILTSELAICPTYAPGEICISGAGVAAGYLNQPELSAGKFIADPFGTDPSLRLYRTGDLGRRLQDGTIEFLGRKDDQVKIRGYRIELAEVETAVGNSPGIRQCAVLAKEDKHGARRLVAYVAAAGIFDKRSTLAYLETRLPDYMLPALWVQLEQLPLTSNGKIDRRALPDPVVEQVGDGYTAPRNELEQQLANIWKELLEVDQVGATDNFFELGGHSILAIRVVSAIRKQLEIEITIGDIFDYPTVGELAAQIRSTKQESAVSNRIVPRANEGQSIPLSFSQERIWFIDQLNGSLQYHIPWTLRLNGNINKEALVQALRGIVNRHEVLRTMIRQREGQVYQYIQEADSWTMEFIDRPDLKNDPLTLRAYLEKLIRQPFDLSADPKLRAHLVGLGEKGSVLIITLHHIASDGWSHGILVKEFMELYSAYAEERPVQLLPLPVQYADYAIWQRQYLQGELLNKKLAYWKQQLAGSTPLQLPVDFSRPQMQSTRGGYKAFRIDKETTTALQYLSQQEEVTLFMTLLTAFQVLLSRYSGQHDISVGTPIANRTQHEIEGLIGFFANTIVIRSNMADAPAFTDLLQRVKQTTLEAYEHQDVPFEKIVEAVVRERDTSRPPLFQVMFVLQNNPATTNIIQEGLPALKVGLEPQGPGMSKFDITLSITERTAGLYGSVEYCADLFSDETIDRLMEHFKELLKSITNNPYERITRLSLLTAAEQQQLRVVFNETAMPYARDKTIVDLISEQAHRTPHQVAVQFEEEQLTYKELEARSNQLAHYLHRKGITTGNQVALCLERSTHLVIGILAVLKAGAAYVPVDTAYPADRIAYMLEDSSALAVVSTMEWKELLPGQNKVQQVLLDRDAALIAVEPVSALLTRPAPEHLAYVIYTSGSTGRPKGAGVYHHSIVNLAQWYSREFSITSRDRNIIISSPGFDLTQKNFFGTLLAGGTIVIPAMPLYDSRQISRCIQHRSVTIINCAPNAFYPMAEEGSGSLEELASLRLVVLGGEPINLKRLQRWITGSAFKAEIVNSYGPTECTDIAAYYRIEEPEKYFDRNIPIGKPNDNVQLYVLNEGLQLQPVGITGELYISGDGVGAGYLNDKALTASKFISNLYGEGWLYGTGDLVRRLADGNIEYLGRTDEQVKIRGYRIELAEIENVLLQSGLVSQAVVLARKDGHGNKRLYAYVVPAGDWNKKELLSYAKSRLPEYMAPSYFTAIDRMPLTGSGKIDKKMLLTVAVDEQLSDQYVAPRTQLEMQLVSIWESILGKEHIGINDNFFELGGHSIMAIQMLSLLEKESGIQVPVSLVFKHPVIQLLAEHIQPLINNGPHVENKNT